MKKERLKELFEIDETELDKHISEQSALYSHYAVKEVEAKEQERLIKFDVDILYAEIESEQRKILMNDKGKFTEAQIKSEVIRDKNYQDIVREHIEAKRKAEECGVIVSALEQKKKSLELMVQLMTMDYFGSVKNRIPKGMDDYAVESIKQKIRDKRRAGE